MLPPSISAQFENILSKLLYPIDVPLPNGMVATINALQVGLVILMIFLLIYSIGHLRHTYVGWSFKGMIPGIGMGFILTLILEAILILGGRTAFTELLGWKNPPKPIARVLDSGKAKIVTVLGSQSEVPLSEAANKSTATKIMSQISSLEDTERNELKRLFCE